MMRRGIPVKIDKPPGLAHNKVMIIDSETIITGSFNFTNAAEKRNVENILFIKNKSLAQRYKTQWIAREALSEP